MAGICAREPTGPKMNRVIFNEPAARRRRSAGRLRNMALQKAIGSVSFSLGLGLCGNAGISPALSCSVDQRLQRASKPA